MNLAVPNDLSYVRSESSGTSIPADPADRVVIEKFCPILEVSQSIHSTCSCGLRIHAVHGPVHLGLRNALQPRDLVGMVVCTERGNPV